MTLISRFFRGRWLRCSLDTLRLDLGLVHVLAGNGRVSSVFHPQHLIVIPTRLAVHALSADVYLHLDFRGAAVVQIGRNPEGTE